MNERINKLKQLVHIEEYAEYLGFHVRKIGSYYTLEEHESVMINPVTNRFFHNSSMEPYARGSVINFAMHFGEEMGRVMDYKAAVADLENFIGREALEHAQMLRPVARPGKKKMLILPPHGGSRRHAYAYLSKIRCIDSFIIDYFFASNHLYEDTQNNCVFVSYDEKTGRPDFACRRGTKSDIPFKGDVEGCSYDYCFCLPCRDSKILYVGEAVIDIMSLMTWFLRSGSDKKTIASYHYQALTGTQKYMAVFRYLERHPEIEAVYLALDNDESGRDTVNLIIRTAKEKGMKQTFIPYLPEEEGCDWNDMLKEKRRS